jgi:hypothetical protein
MRRLPAPRDRTGTVKEVKTTTGGGSYCGLLIVLADRAVKQRKRQLAVAVFEAALSPGVHEGFLRQKYEQLKKGKWGPGPRR